MPVSTFSVSYSATGKNLLEANNAATAWSGSVPSGMNPGQVSALKQAVEAAIKALGPTGSFATDSNTSQLHNTSITVTASINPSTHTVSVVVG